MNRMILITCPVASRASAQRGAALLEGALWLSLVLLPMLFGVIEVSRALKSYRVVVGQVQATARYLSTQPPGSSHAQARCLFMTGQPLDPCVGTNLLPGFSAPGFSLSIEDASNSALSLRQRAQIGGVNGGLVNLVTVRASSYRHVFVAIPFGVLGQGGGITFEPVTAIFRQMD